MRKVMCVAGARPNFMKVGPIMHALQAAREVQATLVHTGQHYDVGMNDVFFAELQIPRPDRFLNVGSGSHAVQTAPGNAGDRTGDRRDAPRRRGRGG